MSIEPVKYFKYRANMAVLSFSLNFELLMMLEVT